jgi:hypothetical protein
MPGMFYSLDARRPPPSGVLIVSMGGNDSSRSLFGLVQPTPSSSTNGKGLPRGQGARRQTVPTGADIGISHPPWPLLNVAVRIDPYI